MENSIKKVEEKKLLKSPVKLGGLWKDTRGDTGFVEWLLLVGLIAIAGFVAFQTIGKKVSASADKAGTKIDAVTFSGTP